jgi:hypothetical protein
MNIKVLSTDHDYVISSKFITGLTDYKYALETFVPLIDKLDIQRSLQDTRFYQRLERDLLLGCIMPPITIAMINENVKSITDVKIEDFVNENINDAFILDGIQRLNTIKRTYNKKKEEFDIARHIYLNILICSSMDNLLYRMITLNNGQKPMSARHQIEILTSNLVDFSDSDLPVLTEKEARNNKKIKVAFNRDNFIKAYLAFLSNSTNIENKKIIEEKMDQLIADKIMDTEITQIKVEFSDIIQIINKLSVDDRIFKWLKNGNNLIGFCVGAKTSFNEISAIPVDEFRSIIINFEKAFSSFNYSQIKVGQYRRNLSKYFFHNIERMKDLRELELIDELSQID